MNDKLFSALKDFSEAEAEAVSEYESKNNEWWNALTEEEREDAFYAVCKRIYEARVVENRSYRGTLYGKFGFDPGMYRMGMECGFFTLHNMLHQAREYEALHGVNRFEVIDKNGRTYVNYLDDSEIISYNLQDDDRTLKVFIEPSILVENNS
jgi:hypothetical protein